MANEFRCGDCQFFTCEKQFDKPCQQLGHLETSRGCEKFRPNGKKLKEALQESDNVMDLLAEVVSKVPTSLLHVLSSMLYNEKVTRKFGYRFLQKVYVRSKGVTGADYVNNFSAMYVLEATKNGLRLLSPQGTSHLLKTEFKKGELAGPDIYSLKEWKAFKKTLIDKKKIDDPASKRRKVSQEYLLEDVKQEKTEKTKRKKRYEVNDLVSISKDIERGYATNSRYTKEKHDDSVFTVM